VDTYHARLTKRSSFTSSRHASQQSTRLRRRALSEPTLTLVQLLDIARSTEAAERQVKAMENGEGETRDAVAAVGNRSQNQRHRRNATTTSSNKSGQLYRNCGNEFYSPRRLTVLSCMGKQCRLCSKTNHFALQFRSTGQRQQQHASCRSRRLSRRHSVKSGTCRTPTTTPYWSTPRKPQPWTSMHSQSTPYPSSNNCQTVSSADNQRYTYQMYHRHRCVSQYT